MPKECFNIGVRLLAYSENKRLTSANVKVSKHYMDLRFCVSKLFLYYISILLHIFVSSISIIRSLSHVSKHTCFLQTTSESVELNVQELAKSLETWPYIKYDAPRCRFVRIFLYDYCEPFFEILIPIILQLLMPWARGSINLFCVRP